MNSILQMADANQRRAWEIIKKTNVIEIWKSVGAEINLVGSLRMGLLMKHRDIDFHIYTDPFRLADSFEALARLAEDKHIKQITYFNFLEEKDTCVQWQAIYEDEGGERWQIDMVHIIKGSYYDGYFERMADCIKSVLTAETRNAILQLKQDTPESEHIMGIEYYQAVIRDGVRTMDEFVQWRKAHPVEGVVEWIPQS